MKKFLIENKNLVILWILCGIALFVFCGHYNNILLDVGREVYYPERILEGKVLYKDLFNIYGPFAYLFNALLYKIFTPNLTVLYFSGVLCSFAIVSGVYLIARKFLSGFLSLSIGIFTIITGVCATHLFNFTFPYSWAMLYGTVAFIYSMWALVKFKAEDKTQYFYLAALLGGLCAANKYDFFIYGIFLFITALLTKNKKIILNFVTCFLLFPLICAFVLYFQGLRLEGIVNALNDIKSVIASSSLSYFYKLQGIYFNPKIFVLWIINFLKTGFGFAGLICGVKLLDKNKIAGWIVCAVFAILIAIFTTPPVLIFLVPLTIITAVCACVKLKNNIPAVFLFLGVISVCIKSFWALLALNYGSYVISMVLTAFLAVVFSFADKKYEKAFAIGILAIGLNFLYVSGNMRAILNEKVSTSKGSIYTYEKNALMTQKLIDGLMRNNVKSAYIYPEGLIVNFLSNVKADDYYNSMLPLYTDSLGENRFIDNIKQARPEYIILNNLSMREYGAGFICDGYAYSFRDYLFENYSMVDDIDDGFRYVVFARK